MPLATQGLWRACFIGLFAFCLFSFAAHSQADAITYIETRNDTQQLSGVSDVAVSPDGQFVYAASYMYAGVTAFERNLLTGELSVHNTQNGIVNAFSVDVSPDNKHVYVASPGGLIQVLSRNPETGILTKTFEARNTGGTSGFVSVSVSPDGSAVYGVGGSPSGLVLFHRDPSTGELTVGADYKDNLNGHYLGQAFNPTLSPIKNIASSADGRFVYVTSTTDHAVTLFSRDPTTKLLTQEAVYIDGQGGMDGLQSASSAKLSPDGKHLYVTGQGENSLAVFEVNPTTGELTYLTKVTDGADGVNNIGGVRSLAISPDGRYVLVSAISDNAVTVFVRNAETGFLTLDSSLVRDNGPLTGLYAPSGMSTDPMNRHLYVSGQSAASLVVFSLPTPAVILSTSTASVSEAEGPVVLDGQLEVFDSDSSHLASAVVTIEAGFVSADVLSVTTVAGITASYDSGTGVLTLSGSAPFVSWDSSVLDTQTVAAGGAATAPTAPTRTGYAFTGWDLAFDNVTSDLTVTAQYTLNTYNVVFDLDGGTHTGGGALTQTVNYGAAATAPVFTAPVGKTFSGWSANFNAVTANLTVTAQYTVNTYNVVFDLDGGTHTGGGALTQTVNYGAAATAPVFTAPVGKTFSGWSASFNSVTDNLTVTAQYTVNTYNVVFDLDGGTHTGGGALAQTVNHGSAATAPVFTAPVGKTFSGWSATFNSVTANLTVTAQYTVSTYSVVFDLDGGTRTGGGALTQSVNHGAAATAPVFSTPEGRTFSGWSASFANITANITVTAQYSVNQHAVTVTLMGEGTVTPATQQVDWGTQATFALNLNAGDIAVLSGNCGAVWSNNVITTEAIKGDCSITATIYADTVAEKIDGDALAAHETGHFTISGGAGDKVLVAALIKRSGEEVNLDLDEADALIQELGDGTYAFSASRTGRYTLTYADSVTNSVVDVLFDVLPYVAFTSSNQPVKENSTTNVRLWLSDEPIDYPVVVDFVSTGISLDVEQFELTASHGLRRAYSVTVTADEASITLIASDNQGAWVGAPEVHTFRVQVELPPLSLTVSATQNGQPVTVVSAAAGEVVLSVTELNDAEATYTWEAEGLVLTSNGASIGFNTANVPAGLYTVKVQATSEDGRKGVYELVLRVIAGCPLGDCSDIGLSGLPAAVNPHTTTPNRIPLCPQTDDVSGNRAESCQVEGAANMYAEVPSQYILTMGSISGDQSWESGQFGIAVNDQELLESDYNHIGNMVNFDVLGLEHPGEAVSIMIPLAAGTTIPENAVWRKYLNGQWQNFVVDQHNELHSAARDLSGQCPGVSSSVWTTGLETGFDCVRLTIEDGGPNDADGAANNAIRDPGVLATLIPVAPPTTEPVKNATVKSRGGSLGGGSLLLMGLLGALRFRKTLATLALIPLPVLADTGYFGLEGLAVKTSVSSSDVSAKIAGTAEVSGSSRTGWRIYGGLPITDSLAVELGWLDLGDLATHYKNIPESTTSAQLDAISPKSGQGLELGVRWQVIDRFENIKPSLRAGVWKAAFKQRYIDETTNMRDTDKDHVGFIGADVSWEMNQHWSSKLGVSRYSTPEYGTVTINFGVQYNIK
ncbi:MAG: beta-propeller fold lactonase family protein [Cellvibrionaceae bacterium]|nr:beta-propeller fold lactonase family protein [Cellvibrionaceae bacterium]